MNGMNLLNSLRRLPRSRDRLWRVVLPIAILTLALLALGRATTAQGELPCTPGPHAVNITSDQLWCASDNPHLVTGSIYVTPGATLTIQPGVIVRFSANVSLIVQGNLNATGNSGQGITFTSDQPSPTPGYWRAMQFDTASSVQMDYCDIGYGGGGAWSMLETYSSNVVINHSSIHHSTATSGAIRLLTVGMTPAFRNTQFYNNNGYPIHQSTADMAPVYENLAFSGNTTDAVFLNGGWLNRNVTYDGKQLNGSPYISDSSVVVNSGYTLTINPGTTLRLGSGSSLQVVDNASLSAVGTGSDPIIITSKTPATNFAAVSLGSNSIANLAYCDISRASGVQGAVWLQSSNNHLDHCNIHDNFPGNGAIFVGNTGAAGLTPTVQNTTIVNNTGYAIYHYSFDIAPVYTNLTLSGNGTDAIYLGGGTYNRNVTLDSRQVSGSPFIAGSSMAVAGGNTLTISPGTELRFPQAGGTGSGLTIQSGATLIAEGTSNEPVVLTATSDSARYSSHTFEAGSTVRLAYCDISHAAGSQGVLRISSNAQINHCIIHDNAPSLGAIWLAAAGISPTIQNTLIQNNANYAISQNTPDMAPNYLNLTLTGNGMDAVYLGGGELNRNVTLDSRELGGRPFIAASSIKVNSGFTWRLNPGTELRFPQAGGTGSGLVVSTGATLLAEGLPGEPVVLTSTGASDRYSTHSFQAGSFASLAYCDISHGGGAQGVLSIYSSSVSIDHCNLHDNTPSLGAIWLAAAGISPTIKNSTFQGNTAYAVYQNTADMAPIYENLTASGNTNDAIAIYGGSLATGRNWTIGQSGIPAHILGGTVVQASGFLSLDPGTVLKFASSQVLTINGALYALGTSVKPIQITGVGTSPGAWQTILWNSGSKAILDNVQFSNGGGSGQPMLRIGTSQFSMQNSWVQHSAADGIQIFNNSKPILHYNRIEDNLFGLRNQTPATVVDATHNWWGYATGPYHATNPTGQGNPVSNGVTFSPWLTSPQGMGDLPIGKVYVDLVSQTRASPGQPISYAIWYNNLSTNPVQDAVLVLNLPNTTIYKSNSANGIYWPSRHQVFWKLGTLNPGDSGAVAVEGSYRWGIPDLTLEASMAIMLGSDLESGQLSLADYLNYAPYTTATKTTLTEGQFNAALSGLPELAGLYNQALSAGFRKGSFNRQTTNTGDQYHQTLLLKPDLSEILIASGDPAGALSYVIGRYYITLISPTDIVTYNLQTNTYSSLPQPVGLQSTEIAGSDQVNCLVNCLVMETGTALLTEFAPLLGKIGTISDCTAFLADPSNSEALASCAAGIQTSIPGAGTIVSAVNCYNRSLADPNHCKCTSSMWEGTTMPFAKTEACKKTPCVNGVFATYDIAVYGCPTCTKCVSGSGGSESPWDHCKPTGATPPSECNSTGQLSRGWFLEGHTNQADDIFDGMKICMLIPRDPNAKYGQPGELVPGQPVTYQITYENEGAGRAYGVYVTDVLDAHYNDATLTLGANALYIPATRQIIWTIGELGPKGAADSKGQVTFTVSLKADIPGGTPIFNQAIVYFPSVPEITPTNAVVNYIQSVTALPQNLETNFMTPVAITLQGTDAGGLGLSYAIKQAPLFGVLSGAAPNLVYTPAANYTGQELFTYTASNGLSESDPAEVRIVVHPAANDTQAPVIRWSEPANQDQGVAFRATPVMTDSLGSIYAPFVTIQFSEAMDMTSLTSSNLRLVDSTGHTLTGSIFYDELGNQAVIYPREAFANNLWYTVTVKGSVTDQVGNPLGADYSFTFRVGYAVDLSYKFLPYIRR